MLKDFSVLCLGFLNGAVLGWFGAYANSYFMMGFHVRRLYPDASKHAFVALTIVVVASLAFLLFWVFLPCKMGGFYLKSFFVAMMLFFFIRVVKMNKDHDRHEKNWPQSIGQFETISYGSKRFQLSCLAVVIVLLVLLFIE